MRIVLSIMAGMLAALAAAILLPMLADKIGIDIVDTLSGIWHYKIVSTEGGAVTVANLLVAFTLFIVGVMASKRASKAVGRRILARVIDDQNTAFALQSFSFYLLVAIFTFIALDIAKVPLTVFTFLGGALAIGVGFGSQNILNNFISGIILMIERPIRVGDMVELQGTYGRVIEIGTRSTHIRTFKNVDILVPNSSFLENNVINWTLSGNDIRADFRVGVAHGSPTRKVAELIKQAAEETEGVLKDPPVWVFFSDFEESRLTFEVYFWLKMTRPHDMRVVESGIRHRINELFMENGIILAFPQRDVHLDSSKPLEIKVISS
ncbi:MAG: mechanosensitive ion channel [Alphaproteobacteria bacterium]|nr:mechanosensitive ion channel [Alphaproteobacteria bacterium]